MKWQRGTRNDDVVDIRGQKASRGPASAAKLGGGGAILVVVIGLIASALGVNIPGLGGEEEAAAVASVASVARARRRRVAAGRRASRCPRAGPTPTPRWSTSSAS